MDYVNLHVHSIYSLLDGLASPEELVLKAKEKGMKSLAITDHGSISGALKFYSACIEHGIQPIIGVEGHFCENSREKIKGEKRRHITLLAKNYNGFKSLIKLMTTANENYWYVPRMDIDDLEKTEDLICMTACSYGILSHPNYLLLCKHLKNIFGDDLYLEIMPVDFSQQVESNLRAIEVSSQLDIPIVATNDVHYLLETQSHLHNFLLGMNTGGKLQFEMDGFYMRDGNEMADAFSKICKGYMDKNVWISAIEKSNEIADLIDIQMDFIDISLPIVVDNPEERLRELARQGRGIQTAERVDRLDYELEIIVNKGYADYFLLVHDLVTWARKEGMELGAGRGSAAGSLLCYSLNITDVDPIDANLMFERFLNPERSDYPDIDIDFPRSKRPKVLAYLREKYGEDHVINISTVSKLRSKSAFKDVCKQFEIPFSQVNSITRHIDNDMSLKENINQNKQLKEMIEGLPHQKDIIRIADGIEGTLRQGGTHAAGVVIAPNPITDYGVVEKRKELCINWDMKDCEKLGLVKIDILGLRTLDVIEETRETIRDRHGITIIWDYVPVDTSDIMQEFSDGHTVGIFQFESAAMTSLVKKLSPIVDKNTLIDANALVRPGPMDSGLTAIYIRRHLGEEVEEDKKYVNYIEGIVEDTHGVIVYQEQIIKILCEVAGYSIPEADKVRRVFAKKQSTEEFEKHRSDFVEGCKNVSAMDQDTSNALFDDLEKFSRYGFNKSHAAAYTELALRGMWLKINYPLEFMMALYKWTEEEDKRTLFREECLRLNISIESPDINLSERDFTIHKNRILIGLDAVKQVGNKTVEEILKHRAIREFDSIQDFQIRCPKAKVNKTALKNLKLVGAFSTMADYTDERTEEEKEIAKATLMPGVYPIKAPPSVGLTLDTGRLERLRNYIGSCTNCLLRKAYDNPVAFEYTPKSVIMVVAEAPGKDEVAQGKPLIGRAGEVLMEKFDRYGIYRDSLYLTNRFKCRPFNNVLPEDPPLDCHGILDKEIDILQPKLIISLGGRAMEYFTGQKVGIQSMNGKLHVEIINDRAISVLYGVHPASTFYGNGGDNEKRLEEVVKKVADIYYGTHEEEEAEQSETD